MSARVRSAPGSALWLLGLICGAGTMTAPATALLAAVLLAPGLVALAMDRAPDRGLVRTVAPAGLGLAVGPMASLWSSGGGMSAALVLALHPGTLLICWGAQALAWGLFEALPALLTATSEMADRARAARLRSELDQLRAEWGFTEVDSA